MFVDVQRDGQAQGDFWHKSCLVDVGYAICGLADEQVQPIQRPYKLRDCVWKTI